MKWVVVLLIMAGFFYAAKRFMPSASTIDVTWKVTDIHIGMTEDEVRGEVGGEPSNVSPGAIGHDETWFYNDRYDENKHLAIQFVDGRVFRFAVENDLASK
jgi:hypothetical protein